MCGIVGFTGRHQAAPILLDGLSKLEYRGYDSAGIAVRDGEDETEVIKAKGRLKVLSEKTNGGETVPGTCGIGHTRWATHGEPSENNAHPHMTDDSNIVAVHNGIIENYQELKNKLTRKGYTFYSETDTEVAVKLIDYYYKKYEELCVSILKYILGEYLTLWEQQKTTEENLYRFDMCCKIKNGVTQDFFDTICKYFSTKYIVFEFKNYEKPITQREIYTTEKYLYEKALRKVAIIISRKGADKHAKMAARGSLRESGKLIICLSDEDLKAMLQIKKEGERTTGEYLENILDDMLMRLEK